MPLSDLLTPTTILPSLRVASKAALFAALANRAAQASGHPERAISAAVASRELVGTTGFGLGVALPHGRVANLARPFGVFARLAEPVGYGALDGEAIDLAFLLLSPEGDGSIHLKALARVSRAFRDGRLVAKLRGASGVDSLFALLAGVPVAVAA